MELSVRSFLKEIKENGVTLVRFYGSAVSCDEKRVLSFYREVEGQNEKAIAHLTEAEKARYLSASTPKEKYAYRSLRFDFSCVTQRRDEGYSVRRKTELSRGGRILAVYEDEDVWDESGFLKSKNQKKSKRKLSNTEKIGKITRFLTKIFRKAS